MAEDLEIIKKQEKKGRKKKRKRKERGKCQTITTKRCKNHKRQSSHSNSMSAQQSSIYHINFIMIIHARAILISLSVFTNRE
jgi:hypothetical protein